MALNKDIISGHKLARDVIKAYELAGGTITGVEFHNSENGRTKHRVNINGSLEVKLWMQYEHITPALFSIYINIHTGTWLLRTHGYLDEVNVEYDSHTTSQEYTFNQLKEWVNDFVSTVYQLKAAEVHGFVIVP